MAEFDDLDVLIVGEHPAAALCALILATPKGKKAQPPRMLLNVAPAKPGHLTQQPPYDILSAAAAKLHPQVATLLKDVPTSPIAGVRFLGPGKQIAWRDTSPPAHVVSPAAVSEAMAQRTAAAGVTVAAESLTVEGVDRQGVHFRSGRRKGTAKMVVVADPLDAEFLKPLGVRPRRATHRLYYALWEGGTGDDLLPVGLEIAGTSGTLGRLLRGPEGKVVATLHQPMGRETRSAAGFEVWCDQLRVAGLLEAKAPAAEGVTEVAVAAALAEDMVGDRALLIGPAGGFVSSFGESLYPGLWSAVFAAEAVRTAVGAEFPQDELQRVRGTWGSTLGEYLRGPQQNLPFLLPLVYGNDQMAARLGRAVLRGESLVH